MNAGGWVLEDELWQMKAENSKVDNASCNWIGRAKK